jgi:hypothetical protein
LIPLKTPVSFRWTVPLTDLKFNADDTAPAIKRTDLDLGFHEKRKWINPIERQTAKITVRKWKQRPESCGAASFLCGSSSG